ncbi:hypothetical protein DEG02_018640 [Xanthomonas vasicola]|nr:hypothetical protein KWO_012770 [Xanthomonas vasicola pv. musacearum NCPPB 4379]KFA11496.1 hypothetical protein KWM_0106445 [Xanthomonas vasicola pv. musacearum NCPPB 2005]KFA15132.1 hypothetical protein KWQ_0102595 [Xanthomonas vasicola pv. musacearum NCPPB 4380]KFA20850.1 hypothetical protein A11G_0103495 [Xanthomonas vasicola pv. musacearum NCPPB 4392]KFA24461.1 hypothetical protein KWU_0105080 [Xanthomonas vasicola pv. musacearum NCPPB 4394]KFA37232.1 hypothetical protein KWS_0110185 [X
MNGSVRGDTAIDLAQSCQVESVVRSFACLLQAIYTSASLHVQLASHCVLQVLREVRNALQAASWLMALPWLS